MAGTRKNAQSFSKYKSIYNYRIMGNRKEAN